MAKERVRLVPGRLEVLGLLLTQYGPRLSEEHGDLAGEKTDFAYCEQAFTARVGAGDAPRQA